MPLDRASKKVLNLHEPADLRVENIADIRKAAKQAQPAWDIPQVGVWREKDRLT